jgi:hypothetical protein
VQERDIQIDHFRNSLDHLRAKFRVLRSSKSVAASNSQKSIETQHYFVAFAGGFTIASIIWTGCFLLFTY